ncbi:MAG: META domain-containing protein [Oscillatoriaceae cyanobacterium Prado104]|jgi:para-nitrobenzyl esterase|nr:META domain-containing protein [Oscillatoriaceae cyanobacterium Prado104]
MKKSIHRGAIVLPILLLTVAIAVMIPVTIQAGDRTPRTHTGTMDEENLAGTSWQLFKLHAGDGKTSVPDDKAKYTIAFNDDGSLNARIDCNRGRGTWKSPAPNRLEFGPLALTRALCPPGSLHDRIVKDWESVRFYIIKDGYLFVSLVGNGGIYEFEPIRTAQPAH